MSESTPKKPYQEPKFEELGTVEQQTRVNVPAAVVTDRGSS